MKNLLVVGFLASAALGGAPRPPDDVSIRISLSDSATAGPLARLTVRNLGTNPQPGILVRVFGESESGPLLWSGTLDLSPGQSAVLSQRIFLDQDTTVLAATATPSGSADADPKDNTARGALGLRGGAGRALVGRSIHLAYCASCHGQDAEGGAGPPLAGAAAETILARTASGGDHDFPWLSRRDARTLARFFRDPAGLVLPPPLPPPPPGGWPTYSGAVKPLLDDRCIRCHRASNASSGVRLETFGGASAFARRSLAQVKSGRMPQGGKRFDPAEVGVIQDWIDGGRRP